MNRYTGVVRAELEDQMDEVSTDAVRESSMELEFEHRVDLRTGGLASEIITYQPRFIHPGRNRDPVKRAASEHLISTAHEVC